MELQIRDVSKTYANGVQALKHVNLTIPMGMYGVFAEGDGGRGHALYLRKHRLAAGRHTVTVTVPGRPALAGVDPRYLLLTKEKEEMDARMATVAVVP